MTVKLSMALEIERNLSEEERAIAEWLLTHAESAALSYLPQLNQLRVTGGCGCGCGCPTVDVRTSDGSVAGEACDNPVADAFGRVGQNLVGVMLLQKDGFLSCLEIYDLSDIEHPYGLPALSTLEPALWNKSDV